MKLYITAQYMENYGAHEWDGVGECPQYWKAKGGEDYFYNLDDSGISSDSLSELVAAVRTRIEWSDNYSRQYMVSYEVVADDYMTEFERSQLEYEGRIAHPAVTLLSLAEVGVDTAA
jgi:hypothetical protein